MLYDNALLSLAYLEAYQVRLSISGKKMRVQICMQVTEDRTYADIAQATLEYVQRVMENKDMGGFFSAEDADSEGEEGKFYVWTKRDIEDLLTPEVRFGIVSVTR